MGLLWPPQVRKYIMSGRSGDELNAAFSNDRDVQILTKLKLKQQSMDGELSEVKLQLEQLNGNMLKILAVLEKPASTSRRS